MPKKVIKEENGLQQIRPALSPDAEESQMIALATILAKKRLMEGTATSQEVVFYLKLGSSQARLERERLEEENKLLKAKTETLERAAKNETDYNEVIQAFKGYRGEEVDNIDYSKVYVYEQ